MPNDVTHDHHCTISWNTRRRKICFPFPLSHQVYRKLTKLSDILKKTEVHHHQQILRNASSGMLFTSKKTPPV